MKRKTGFYWCNIGKPKGWLICYFEGQYRKEWYVPIYNYIIKQQGEMEYFEEIDEARLVYHKEHKIKTK